MTSQQNTPTAGGAPGRPAHSADSEQGQHDPDSVLFLNLGAGPEHFEEECMVPQRRQARPVRFDDPARNAAYWARIDRIVDTAPPLDDTQRAVIFTAFHAPATQEAA